MDAAIGACGVGDQVRLDFVPEQRPKHRPLIQALFDGARASGFDCRWLTSHPPSDAWVVLYGLGAPDRVRFANRQRLIAFDAGYWDRHGDDRRFRISIGGFHCPGRIMEGSHPGAARWMESGLKIRQAKAVGPILLVGNGPKSNAVGAQGWAARKAMELRIAFPGQRILYRPKPKRPPEHGVRHDGLAVGEIDEVLQKVSLVVCRHSNVAVDACRWSVPVVCDDGAAAAIYPRTLAKRSLQPGAELRTEFLQRLAWWQWTRHECESGAFWKWMTGRME